VWRGRGGEEWRQREERRGVVMSKGEDRMGGEKEGKKVWGEERERRKREERREERGGEENNRRAEKRRWEGASEVDRKQ
jgi:hypothetical protein